MSSTYRSNTAMMNDVESGRWADRHGVFHCILPYGYRSNDPLEVIQAIRKTCRTLGKFKQTFTIKDVDDCTDLRISRNHYEKYLYFSGAWPCVKYTQTNPTRYGNPFYTHDVYPPVTEREYRFKILRDTYEIPYWNGTKLSHAFGISQSRARELRIEAMGALENHHYNLTKWARTMELLRTWGYTSGDLADIFPYQACVIRQQISRHARDFDPPANPLKEEINAAV